MQGLMREKDDVMIERGKLDPRTVRGVTAKRGMSVIGGGRSGGVGH